MNLLRRLARAIRHPVSQNALALNLLQVGNLFVPLVTLPYTSRVLGSAAFGLVAFAQSLSFLLGLVIAWGLDPWGARDAAEMRGEPGQLSALVAQITGARLLLSVGALVIAAGVAGLEGNADFVALAWLGAAATGLNPNWFFVGIERLRLVATVGLGIRIFAAALTFLLVDEAGDAWIVMALFSGSSVLTATFAVTLLARRVDLLRPRLRPALVAIRGSAQLFVGTAGITLYTALNVVLLGFLGTLTQVAHFSAAERIIRAALQLLQPASVAIFPRITYLDSSGNRPRALRLLFTGGVLLVAAGSAGGALLLAFAPGIVRVIYGSEFAEAAVVLRLMAPILPIGGATLIAGLWLMARRQDARVMWITLAAGALNLTLAPVLVHLSGTSGMAVSVLCAEFAVMALAISSAMRLRSGPVDGRARTPS